MIAAWASEDMPATGMGAGEEGGGASAMREEAP